MYKRAQRKAEKEKSKEDRRELRLGQVVVDNVGEKWRLGKAIGHGGFGEIFDIKELRRRTTNKQFVAKIEKHTNGPLFVEINCYLRLAKLEMIEQWKKAHNLKFLGLPHFVASGSNMTDEKKYRFLIIPKYREDLEVVRCAKGVFNVKTVLILALRLLDILEYFHAKGYVHSDIKSSNIMLDWPEVQHNLRPRKNLTTQAPRERKRNLKPANEELNYIDDVPYFKEVLKQFDGDSKPMGQPRAVVVPEQLEQIYLVDYGLATKYLQSNGRHKEVHTDDRRAHAGTLLFCSRDAHVGIVSRRSDLESLAYNMVYWLTGSLPWINKNDLEMVAKMKNRSFNDVETFLRICFQEIPGFLIKFFKYLSNLEPDDDPNYDYLKTLFSKSIKSYGYKQDGKLDFNNVEGWGKQPKIGSRRGRRDNRDLFKRSSLLMLSPLMSICSPNVRFKRPKLRQKAKSESNAKTATNDSLMNWSKLLTMDPESILKRGAHNRKGREIEENVPHGRIANLDLEKLNPTPVMRLVFDRAMKQTNEMPRSVDKPIEGYTEEMIRISKKMQKERESLQKKARKQIGKKKRKPRKRLRRISFNPSQS